MKLVQTAMHSNLDNVNLCHYMNILKLDYLKATGDASNTDGASNLNTMDNE